MLQLSALPLQVDGLGLGTLELGGGLAHVGFRHDAGAVLVLGQAQRARIGGDRGIEQARLLVEHPQLQVVLHQFALQAQARGGEICGTGLELGTTGLQATAQLAPDIQFPRRAEAQVIALADARCAGAAVRPRGALPRTRDPGATGQCRVEAGPGAAHQRARLAVLSLGRRQVLVGQLQALDQRVQLGIAVQGPPVAARQGIGRGRRGPALDLLELYRCGQFGALIVRAEGAARQQPEQQDQAAGTRQAPGPERTSRRKNIWELDGFHSGLSNEASVRTPRQRLTRWRRRSK